MEIMEVLSLFTWNFQRQNSLLSEMLNNSNGNRIIIAEQSTRLSMSMGGGGIHS